MAIMSILDDLEKQSIHPLLPSDLKYGSILWIYVICEVRFCCPKANVQWRQQEVF